jgi:hypothetical protein
MKKLFATMAVLAVPSMALATVPALGTLVQNLGAYAPLLVVFYLSGWIVQFAITLWQLFS